MSFIPTVWKVALSTSTLDVIPVYYREDAQFPLSTMEYREVRTFAEEYFAGSSALNRKILGDIASVRTSCQGWDTLPVLQQDQVNTH